ncbi:hypothetical protein ACWF95_18720 [Streptomyces vinaceus]
MSAAAAAAVLTGLITAAAPAAAAGPACTPDILRLPALADGPSPAYGSVRAFGSGGLVAGESAGLPAYWTADHAVHALPLPEGFVSGEVRAVNAKGLMVGVLRRAGAPDTPYGFTYQKGAAAVRLIGGGTTAGAVTDVNDAGRSVGMEGGVPKEWLNGALVRELPVPADARPGTRIVSVNGINARGDIVGTAQTSYEEDDQLRGKTFPVVWPAGGGYPPYSLQVWTEDDRTVWTTAAGIDDRGRVVGHEDRSYRDWQERKPAVWKKPYDALPNDPGRVKGYEQLTFDGLSGTGPDSRSSAYAASDDDRVGGTFYDWATMKGTAVVWTCASKQAYAPQG